MPAKNKEDGQWGEKLNTNTEFKKTSALADGQSIEGTVLAFKESSKFPGITNVVMQDEGGKSFTLTPSGNLKYAIRDGLLKIGNTYKIQREGTKKIKGMNSAVFGIYPSKYNQKVEAAGPASAEEEI